MPVNSIAPSSSPLCFPLRRILSLASFTAVLALAGCAGPGEEAAETRDAPAESGAANAPEARPATVTDTIQIEGMSEPIELRLFEAPDDFPLPFTAYIPEDMATEVGESTLEIIAEFGGTRNESAFIHVFVFPEDTPWQEAVATAKGFKAGHGLPVSQGLEPLQDDLARPAWLGWADEAYRYFHQSGAESFGGTLGLGSKDGRAFMIVTQRPVEYAEGFGPRARLILESWRWADGTMLGASEEIEGAGWAPPGVRP